MSMHVSAKETCVAVPRSPALREHAQARGLYSYGLYSYGLCGYVAAPRSPALHEHAQARVQVLGQPLRREAADVAHLFINIPRYWHLPVKSQEICAYL